MKKKSLRIISAFTLAFFLVFYANTTYNTAKAEGLTLAAILAANPELGPICVIGVSALAIGLTIKNWDTIKAFGKMVYDDITNKGHTVDEVVDGTSVKYTDWYKESLVDVASNVPNTITEENAQEYNQSYTFSPTMEAKIVLKNPVSVTNGQLLKFRIHVINKTLSVGQRAPLFWTYSNVDTTGVVSQPLSKFIEQADLIDSNTMYVYSKATTTEIIKSVKLYDDSSSWTIDKLEFIEGINSVDMTGAKASIPATKEDIKQLLDNKVATNETITYKQDIDLLNKTVADLQDVSISSLTEAQRQTGILQGIKELIVSIPQKLDMLLNPTVPQNISVDFSPLQVATTKFPFSIPWDFANVIGEFRGRREAPKWKIELPSLLGIQGASSEIDMSKFDEQAKIVRWFVLIGFLAFLILVTRNIIGG